MSENALAEVERLVEEIDELAAELARERTLHQQTMAERDGAAREAARLRELLRRFEWADHDRSDAKCPVCTAYLHRTNRPGRHDPGCWLDAEIRRGE